MDDEIRSMFKQLLAIAEETRDEVRALVERGEARDASNAKRDGFNAKQEAHNARVEKELYEIKTDIKVINARLDEQGRVLTAMIPTRLAAVPAAE